MIESLFFQIFIFFLPTQLSYHYFAPFSLVSGIRVDYLALTIYLSDILLLPAFYFLLKKSSFRQILLFTLAFFIAGLITVSQSVNWQVGLYGLVKVAEFTALAIYIYKNAESIENKWSKPFIFSSILISLVAVGQFVKKGSIGGLMKLVGERPLNVSTPGIAKINLLGHQFLRPYSFFPHPNALAGFLLISFIVCTNSNLKYKRAVSLMFLVSIAITFSKAAMMALVLYLILKNLNVSKMKHASLALLSIVSFASISLALASLPLLEKYVFPEFIKERLVLGYFAGSLFSSNPLFGVGPLNYIVSLPALYQFKGIAGTSVIWILQPVHNIILLVMVEAGIVGSIFFILLFYRALKSSQGSLYWYLLATILITGLFDHYWLTLQQNRFLLSIVLGLSLSPKIATINTHGRKKDNGLLRRRSKG